MNAIKNCVKNLFILNLLTVLQDHEKRPNKGNHKKMFLCIETYFISKRFLVFSCTICNLINFSYVAGSSTKSKQNAVLKASGQKVEAGHMTRGHTGCRVAVLCSECRPLPNVNHSTATGLKSQLSQIQISGAALLSKRSGPNGDLSV